MPVFCRRIRWDHRSLSEIFHDIQSDHRSAIQIHAHVCNGVRMKCSENKVLKTTYHTFFLKQTNPFSLFFFHENFAYPTQRWHKLMWYCTKYPPVLPPPQSLIWCAVQATVLPGFLLMSARLFQQPWPPRSGRGPRWPPAAPTGRPGGLAAAHCTLQPHRRCLQERQPWLEVGRLKRGARQRINRWYYHNSRSST